MKKRVIIYTALLAFLFVGAFASSVILTSFNSGELSPELGARIDFNKYASGLQTAFNAVPLAQGGITRRPGTEYLGAIEGQATGEGRLIPFVFSEEQAYILEFTDSLMRVWADGGLIQTIDSYTKLLVHADAYNTSATFVDSGTDTVTITAEGNAQQDSSQKKFGGSSAWFDGIGDYIHVADSASWYMAADPFTIDFWVRPNKVTGAQGLFQQYVNNDNRVYAEMNTTSLGFYIRAGGVSHWAVLEADCFTLGAWTHVAIVRDATNITYYINGISVHTGIEAEAWPDLAAVFEIGRGPAANYFNGHIDEFRVSKGIARWSANFTPPTFSYPAGDSSGATYELAAPYAEGDLSKLKYVQSADTMYIVHPDYMPRKLERTAHDSWSFTSLAWTDATTAVADRWPAFQDINTSAITLDPSATTGVGITITASASFFNAGHIGAYFKHDAGMYVITAVASGTSATATVIDDLTGHAATLDWYESAWSIYRGFPSTIAFFEQRLVFANNSNQPQTLWMSESGDYEDFVVNATVADSDGVTATILAEQVNAIKWLVSDRKLLIGTTGGEWWLSGDTSDNAVTPSSILVRNATNYGSGDVQPLKAGVGTLFVQRPGTKIRQYQYKFDTDSYQATNLSVLAEHITESVTIKEIVYQQQPHQLIWCRLSDGTLATLSYMPEHDVYAWARHEIGGDGFVESLATIPGATDDEVYMIVRRTINGAIARYVERLKPFYFAPGAVNSVVNAVYVDSAGTYSGAAATLITGLSHLEGEAVDILADGEVVTGQTVSTIGSVSLTEGARVVHVGLNYVTDIQTLRLSAGSPINTIQGRLKRINKVIGRFYKTQYATAGPDEDNLDVVISSFATEEEGTIRISQGVSSDGVVFIRQNQPGPMTVLGLMLDVEVY